VVEQPVAQLAEPLGAPLDPELLPGGLVGAHTRHGGGDLGRAIDGDVRDHRLGRRIGHLEGLALRVLGLVDRVDRHLALLSPGLQADSSADWLPSQSMRRDRLE
jgi:hypothetical protein